MEYIRRVSPRRRVRTGSLSGRWTIRLHGDEAGDPSIVELSVALRHDSKRADKAAELYRGALAIQPEHTGALEGLLASMGADPEQDPQRLVLPVASGDVARCMFERYESYNLV